MSSNGNNLHIDKEVQMDIIFLDINLETYIKNTKILILLGLKMPFLGDIT